MERFKIGWFKKDGLLIYAVADTEKKEILNMFANIKDAKKYLSEVQDEQNIRD
jgi:hypothetical protein